jgi:O-antigen ligase
MHRVAVIVVTVAFAASALAFLRTNDDLDRTIAPILNPNQFSLDRTNEASSEYYRIALLKAVTDRLEGRRWIYGFGRGTFYLAGVESNYDNADHILGAGDSHYILLLLETGIFGLAAFVLLLLAAFRACARRAIFLRGNSRLVALASLGAVAGFIWNNSTASMFPVLPLNLMFWIPVAAAVALPLVPRKISV